MDSRKQLLQWMDNTISQLEENTNKEEQQKKDDSSYYIGVDYDSKTNKYNTTYTDPTGNVHIFKSFVTSRAAAICFDALSILVGKFAKIPYPQLNFPPSGYNEEQTNENNIGGGDDDIKDDKNMDKRLKRLKSIKTARSLIRQRTTEQFKVLKSWIASAKQNVEQKELDKLKQDLNEINNLIIKNKWRENNYRMPKFYVKHMADIHFKLISMEESEAQQKLLKIFDDKLNFNQIRLFTRTKSFWDGEFSDLEENIDDKKKGDGDTDNADHDDTGKCDCGGFLIETKARICSFCGDDINRLHIRLFGCTRCGFDESNALCLSCQTAKNLEELDDIDISEDEDFDNPTKQSKGGINIGTSDMGMGFMGGVGGMDDMGILERLERLDQVRETKNEMKNMMGVKRLKSYEYLFPDRQHTVDMPEYQEAMQLLVNPLSGTETKEDEKKEEEKQEEIKGKKETKGGGDKDDDDEKEQELVEKPLEIFGEFEFGARVVVSPAMMIGRKLEALHERIDEYKQEKLNGNKIFEIKGNDDWKLMDKKQQEIIINIIEMLKEIKSLSEQYFKDYLFQNEWAHHLLDVFSKIEFGFEQWNVFDLYRQKSDQLITNNLDGDTITTRNIMGAFNEYKQNIKPMPTNTSNADDNQ